MYYPFLRGKQHELFALRDLNEAGILTDRIIPIIEPVKYSTQLVNTLNGLLNSNRRVIVIMNPSVGTFVDDLIENEEQLEEVLEIMSHSHTIIGYHLESDNALDELPQIVERCGGGLENVAIFHNDLRNLNTYDQLFGELEAQFNFIPDETPFRRRFANNNGIVLKDSFEKRTPNAEYLNHEDEWFSAEHLYHEEEGFIGFADYSIVGEEYTESGFGAKAVAIHILYPDNQNHLRIRHFVSDSNENRADQAGKFGEALGKFIEWYNENSSPTINTQGLNELLACHHNGNFPGLGMLKRFSIKHHLELIDNILVRV